MGIYNGKWLFGPTRANVSRTSPFEGLRSEPSRTNATLETIRETKERERASGISQRRCRGRVRFVKDNRLLPKGFNKRIVDQEIAPQGSTMTDDDDFSPGGDKIRYEVAIDNAQGPFKLEAELLFKPIS